MHYNPWMTATSSVLKWRKKKKTFKTAFTYLALLQYSFETSHKLIRGRKGQPVAAEKKRSKPDWIGSSSNFDHHTSQVIQLRIDVERRWDHMPISFWLWMLLIKDEQIYLNELQASRLLCSCDAQSARKTKIDPNLQWSFVRITTT